MGVLALQGDFVEHIRALDTLAIATREIRLPRDLEGLDGLVIPGGESTTISLLMDSYGLREPVKSLASRGVPVWGTCAGLIMLAETVVPDYPKPLGLMNIKVARNTFGRQVDSFEADITVCGLAGGLFHAIFIRAPLINWAGNGVNIIAQLHDGRIVAARQGNMLGTAFHPELGDDYRMHKYFLAMVKAHR